VVLALPVFLVAGWPFEGWLVAAVLWAAAWAFGFLLTRLPLGADSVSGSIAAGVGMSLRTFAAGVVLIAVTVSNQSVGLAAAGVYVLAFTIELALSLVSYYASEPL
jgi:hypothetical protein